MTTNTLSRVQFGMPMPFDVFLPEGDRCGERLECLEDVRILPDRRLVCRGRLDGEEVFAKFFVHAGHSRNDFRREVDGAHALEAHGIAAPQMLYAGKLNEEEIYVVVYEAIMPSLLFREAWQQQDETARQTLLRSLITILARMHHAGLLQKDLHLNNFILKDGQIYVLDAGSLELHSSAVDVSQAHDNLALLFAQFLPEDDRYIKSMMQLYAEYCASSVSTVEVEELRRTVKKKRKYRKRKYLEKIFRECSAFVSGSSATRFVMLDRRHDSDAVRNLLLDPDKFLQPGSQQFLKQGNTCTIGSAQINQVRLVIKRYNIKNFWHAIKRALRRTRAAISWENAHRLLFYGIATATPVALVESRFGPIRRKSYFIMEYVEGPSCVEYFTSEDIDMQSKQHMAEKIASLFARLVSHKISHGDMKARNILIHDGQPVLVDLDAMKEHSSTHAFIKAYNRDMRRFFKNWNEWPHLLSLFADVFHKSGLQLPAEISQAKQ